MNPWDELVAAALVGTERRPAPPPAPGGALGELISKLDGSDPSTRLLNAAAVVSAYERAGRLPITMHPSLEASPLDDLPRCPDSVARRFESMGSGAKVKLLPEWLKQVAALGLRVPEQYLPTLLQLGLTHPALREPIHAVLGARGRWLAAQNEDWSFVAAAGGSDSSESHWSTGTRDERLGALKQLRRTDPVRARELLASTWPQESPDDRARFLATLVESLGDADEPFLESALDDKRKEVRETASDLLSRLPGSRLCLRMTERLEPLVIVTRRQDVGLDLKLPAECDKGMARDGIEKKPPLGLGERSWWLQQMISGVPLGWWEATLGHAPKSLLGAASAGDAGTILLAGWSIAAARQRDARWAAGLLPRWLELPNEQGRVDAWRGLLTLLSSEQLEAIALPKLQCAGKDLEWFLQTLLEGSRGEWSGPLCSAILNELRELVRKNHPSHHPWTWKPLLTEFAVRIPFSILAEALNGWADEGEPRERWGEALEEFLSLVQFRIEMHREFIELTSI